MAIAFSVARDGSTTCAANSVLLHSAYNPNREAERFVASLKPSFVPHIVVITEPGLSYTAQFLRQRFHDARLIAIRYCTDFADYETQWDGVIAAGGGTGDAIAARLRQALFDTLGEEGLLSAYFCAWQPAAKAFPDIDAAAWRAIEGAVRLARDVLATRTRYATRWMLNSVALCVGMERVAEVQAGSAPIVVAASGASLAGVLPHLKKYQGEYFLIALSSALLPLVNAGIKCHLCLTTDGGYYAGKHLAPYTRGTTGGDAHTSGLPPLAIAAEGYCPSAVIRNAVVVPLAYPDGPASCLLQRCTAQNAMTAERNGTVSGTALKAALRLTKGNVYFCGLDMASGAGWQHCQPNVLDVEALAADTRLRTTESRVTAARFSTASLEIYRQWFASLGDEEVRRVYRLSDGYEYGNTLGHIRDVGMSHFCRCLDAYRAKRGGEDLPRVIPRTVPSAEERRRIAAAFIKETGGTAQWLHEIFLADCLSCERAATDGEVQERREALQEKNRALLAKIQCILGGGNGDIQ